jgi:UDP-N-acetylmuramoyl-L-alanyl-D-glutamate--2,6-diaminopimelate ligase
MPFERVVAALSAATGVKGRAEVVPTGRDFTVVIDYAHTPDGLENICRTLKECCNGRLVTLFGCGGDRDKTKRPKMGAIAAAISDYLVVTSDNPRSEEPSAIIEDIVAGLAGTKTPYTVIENRVEAIHWAIANAQAGDTILLAGKGHETYQILKSGTIHLDEREAVADALAALTAKTE